MKAKLLIDNSALYTALLALKMGKLDYRKLGDLGGAKETIFWSATLGPSEQESQAKFFGYLKGLSWDVRQFDPSDRAHPMLRRSNNAVLWSSIRFSMDIAYELAKSEGSCSVITDDPAIADIMRADKREGRNHRLMFFVGQLGPAWFHSLSGKDGIEFVDLRRYEDVLFNTQHEVG